MYGVYLLFKMAIYIGFLRITNSKPTKMANKSLFLSLSLLLCFAIIAVRSEDADCVYTIYLRTGSIWKGGTDSIIGLKLYDKYGDYIYITDLEAWGGLMEPGHNYYERGNLDIFSGRGPCLEGPVCAINLTSDGSGPHHGWYCNYVEVSTTGVHAACAQQQFNIEQWLALDTAPYELSAVRNNCTSSLNHPYVGIKRYRKHGLTPNRGIHDPSVLKADHTKPESSSTVSSVA